MPDLISRGRALLAAVLATLNIVVFAHPVVAGFLAQLGNFVGTAVGAVAAGAATAVASVVIAFVTSYAGLLVAAVLLKFFKLKAEL